MTVFEYHTAIDEMLGHGLAKLPADMQPCCGRCTSPHCCSEAAYADAIEIDSMLEALTPEGRAHVEARTLKWRAVFAASPEINNERSNAFEYRNINLPCPFLKDGRCLGYERRPMDCRIFLALGDPEDCAMPNRRHQKYAEFPHPSPLDEAMMQFAISNGVELDHIGAHLVRKLLGDPEFTTASHQRIEITT